MNFKYELSRKNYKKLIKKTNSKYNSIYIIMTSIIYLFIVRDLLLDNFYLMLIVSLIIVLIMYLMVSFITILSTNLIVKMNEKKLGVKYGIFDCTLTKDTLTQKIDKDSYVLKLKDIVRTKKDGNAYFIYTKKIMIIFNKELFSKQEDYEKLIEKIEKR